MAKKQEPDNEPLLTLDEIVPERSRVMIYGKVYELRAGDEFSLKQRAQLQRLVRDMDKTASDNIADATDFEIAASEKAIDDLFNMGYADVPPEVVARMQPEQKRVFNITFYTRFMTATTVTKSESLIQEEADRMRRRLGRLTGAGSFPTSKPVMDPQAA